MAAAIELRCIVRETRTAPIKKNSVPHRVKLIMHTKRIVEVRLWFYYIAGFQGSVKTTVTECGVSEVQNDTTMPNKT
jgi:alpha-galactosidase/6-phospho-beta-glucosidase family protein